jgi:hypothetical protein
MARRRGQLLLGVVLVLTLLIGASIAMAADRRKGDDADLKANLNGSAEIPFNSSRGTGRLTAKMTATQITFKLTYQNLTGNPLFAHIHIGQKFANGGVSVFFCGGGGKPACPAATSGTVEGTIVAADVLGPANQNTQPGDFASLQRAIRLGQTYANIHTPNSPAGEIRGQIKQGKGGGKDDDDDD